MICWEFFLALVFFSENVFFFAETSNGIISEEEGDSSRAKKIYKFRSLSSTKRIWEPQRSSSIWEEKRTT